MAVAIQDVTQAAAASSSFCLGVSSGLARLFPLTTFGNAAQYAGTGTGAVTRTLRTKIEEIERSVIDFGADPTGVADSTTAFTNAIASGAKVLRIPAGTYKVTSLTVNQSIHLKGDGRNHTHINFTTTSNHGMILIGATALGLSNVIRMTGLHLEYTGAGQAANCHGLLVQRKLIADEVHVQGFTNDGVFFAPSNADPIAGTKGTVGNAVFFAYLSYFRSSDNGRDGFAVRMGANANTFMNCQGDRNGRYGFHHYIDGNDDGGNTGSTYGNVIISGQCSYCSSYGYYFESGTNIQLYGAYAEYNNSSDHTVANGYGGVGQPLPVDFYCGDNIVRSWINIGVLLSASTTHVRNPLGAAAGTRTGGNTATIAILEGGRYIYGVA